MSANDLGDQLSATWEINARLTLDLFDSLSDEQFGAVAAQVKGVQAQFAHIHHVRIGWLKLAPDLAAGLEKIPKDSPRATYREALQGSSTAIGRWLQRAAADGAPKGNWTGPVGLFAYMVAHESHHRGQLEVVLRQSGMPLTDEVSYALWDWR